MNLNWGTKNQLKFENEYEYYKALGVFANPEFTRIYVEDNASRGSYSDAYRLQIRANAKSSMNLPQGIRSSMKDGGRINCNDYVRNLLENYGFVLSGSTVVANFDDVLSAISTTDSKYITAFIEGYNLDVDNITTDKKVSYSTESLDVSNTRLQEKPIPHSINRVNTSPKKPTKKFGKRDYIQKAIDNFELGEAGELLVYNHEKKKLQDAKDKGLINDLKNKLKWVSRSDDTVGYDIKSFDPETQKEMYIEVKTTTGSSSEPFYMTENEVNTSKQLNNDYYIYRLYGFKRKNTDEVDFYIIQGDVNNNKKLNVKNNGFIIELR